MSYPQVIVATRRVSAPAGALVIDYGNGLFWRDGARMSDSAYGRPTTSFRIAALLLGHGIGTISYDRVFDAVWGDREDGGPSDARSYIWAVLPKYRKVLESLGVHIKGNYRGGIDISEVSPAEIAALQAKRSRYGRLSVEGRRKAKLRRYGRRLPPAAAVYA